MYIFRWYYILFNYIKKRLKLKIYNKNKLFKIKKKCAGNINKTKVTNFNTHKKYLKDYGTLWKKYVKSEYRIKYFAHIIMSLKCSWQTEVNFYFIM